MAWGCPMNIRCILICLSMVAMNSASADTIAITGATVHTVSPSGILHNGTIIIEDGHIIDIGQELSVPEGSTHINAANKIITPGLFSPLGEIGLSEVGAVAGTNDATQRGKEFAASFDIANAFNPRSLIVGISRVDGVTRAGITPQASRSDGDGNSSHVISGLGSVVHLGNEPGFLTKRGAIVVVNFGESGSALSGGSRATAIQVLKSALNDAADYRLNKAAFQRGERRAYSVSSDDLEILGDVLAGTKAMLFRVNRAIDISVVLTVAEDYGIEAIISGGAEAWMVAEEIAKSNVPVILDGINNLPNNFERINARLDSAKLLADAGVPFAFGAGAQTHNARLITQSAGNAVANGLSWDEALVAVTLRPAEIWGVDGSVGSLEKGKEADLVIWGADPLEITSYPEQVFIKGESISMQNRQTLLRDRYLQVPDEKPPAFISINN
ncbi:MAG: hypothetical protein CMO98_01830 [Woeseia sp.]|nr:hypothetical protein [Woeseia sp.]